MTHIPPAVQGTINELRRIGYVVKVHEIRSGSNRYSVDGAREIDALTLMKRFDACKYPPTATANPPGWQEVDGVQLPLITWSEPRPTDQDAIDAAHDHARDERKHGD